MYRLADRFYYQWKTLARFFQWGGLAWLVDGTLMVIVAGVMLAINWQLALIVSTVIPVILVVAVQFKRRIIESSSAD